MKDEHISSGKYWSDLGSPDSGVFKAALFSRPVGAVLATPFQLGMFLPGYRKFIKLDLPFLPAIGTISYIVCDE